MPKATSVTVLTRERIIQTALAMSRRAGQPPGMRELAAQLSVTPGALYRHVEGQSQLVGLLIDEVMNRVAMPNPSDETDPWERIRIHVHSLTQILDEYPGLDQLIAGHGDESSPARIRQRWFRRQLQDAGLTPADARRAYGVIHMYWLGSRQPPRTFAKAFYFGLDRLIDGLRAFESSQSSTR